eukprot:scaffold307573_cov19-Tisochrysis_lutea.AAC.1
MREVGKDRLHTVVQAHRRGRAALGSLVHMGSRVCWAAYESLTKRAEIYVVESPVSLRQEEQRDMLFQL